MRFAWVHYRIAAPEDGIGRGFLSTAFSLWNALRRNPDVDLVDCGLDGSQPRTHLHMTPLHAFKPIKGKRNVLFSMWEGDVLPAEFLPALRAADQLIVPSTYCQQVWKRAGFDADVVPLGLHDGFQTCDVDRRLLRAPGHRMRFLWVGSRSVRKGWPLLAPAWRAAFGMTSTDLPVQLYVKTIGLPGNQKVEELYEGAVVVDTRDIEPVEMLQLYESADVFVFPTLGEGFGLPALEAMAAGCLVLAPLTGGLTDFYGHHTGLVIEQSEVATMDYGAQYVARIPTVVDVGKALRMAAEAWGTPEIEALRRHGATVARRFTWTAAAQLLAQALNHTAPPAIFPVPATTTPRVAETEDPAGGLPDAPSALLGLAGGPA